MNSSATAQRGTDTARLGRLAAWTGPVLVAVTGASLVAWTWRAWPDPVVDFGRELYVPWRLSAGEVLYRDVAWFNGPLSPYANALLFRVFGAGLMTLVWANLALLAGLVATLHWLLGRLAGRLAAGAACCVALALFGFGQYVGIANYNWVTPYSHEITHGLILAFGTLSALAAWRLGGRSGWLAVAGLALGLSALTKAETFVAAAAPCAVVLAWPRPSRHELLGFAVAALAPPLVAFLALALVLEPREALRGTLGAWPALLESEVTRLPFYQSGLGTDRPAERLGEMLRWSGGWLLVFGPAVALAFAARGARGLGARLAVSAGAATLAALFVAGPRIPWLAALRPLPLVTLAVLVTLALAARRRPAERIYWSLALAFAALALAMLAKMILNARVAHYGFALALPATLLAVVALVGWLPAWLDRRGAHGSVLRAVALAVLAFASFAHLRETGRWLERKTIWVGEGRDAFRADLRGHAVSRALAALASSEARSLAVLPEGVLLNYLARIPNPTPYLNFMPPEMLFFGEGAWLAAFQAHPPDVIALVHKSTAEYGYAFFGRDYAQELAGWVASVYRPVALIGEEPLRPGTRFGIRLLERIEAEAARSPPAAPSPASTASGAWSTR